jgi:2-dehydro-3-deoxyphosphogluconate aldolase/(4S)-4-hydroxy-2-oxoglutarate aldolase
MMYVPTGGVNADNMAEYFGTGVVAACGGSWMVKPELFADGDFSGALARAQNVAGIDDRGIAHRAV